MTPPRLSVLPPLPLGVYARRPSAALPFPLGDANCRLFTRARHGLWHALGPLGLAEGDEVLVPAYHHGSEVEALVRTGLTCVFYDVGEGLEPSESELENLIGPRTRALYLIHYLGFPQDVSRWRAWCDARDLLLLEDAAQAWLASDGGRPLGSFGDLALFCLYKTFGLPDGAALLSSVPPDAPRSRRRLGLQATARRHARWVVTRSGRAARLADAVPERRRYAPEEDFALGDACSRPSAATHFLLARLVGDDAAARRRSNYRLLLEGLKEFVAPALARVPDGASPHAFPVETERRDEVLAELRRNGIRAFAFWSYHHPALPSGGFSHAARWRAKAVVLPVHQELRPADVERIAASAHAALAR
ncbi:MAG: DegT/DnrJ/EryC1/StrS family aminotransferase [Actinomycetota bacterium]|nr:DegT/DnrJ/EryC1/StrS family aminotransferase [Actinomycetota bacterium]